MISRKDLTVPEFYQNYIDKVKEDDLATALQKNTRQFRKLFKNIPRKKIGYAYAEGKWTIKELLQHLIDTERVFAFRALWFARKDASPLPGFDENLWGIAAKAPKRKWNDLLDEFELVRASTIAFFDSLDEDQLMAAGSANNATISVAALGFVCSGHVAHHLQIIRERYLTDKPPVEKKEKAKAKPKVKKKKKA